MHNPRPVGRPAQIFVMNQDQLTVTGGMHIGLDRVHADRQRPIKAGPGVLRSERRGAAMSNHLHKKTRRPDKSPPPAS